MLKKKTPSPFPPSPLKGVHHVEEKINPNPPSLSILMSL
jgi:hypothetical protein